MTRTEMTAGALVLAACTFGCLHGQTPLAAASEKTQTATTTAAPLAFEVVSVKAAPPGLFPPAPAFMRDRGAPIRGLQIMTAPVAYVIAYAYHMQISEFSFTLSKQPDWVKIRSYTFTFRAEGDPTRDQVREMMRTMLADRFGLQMHEFTKEGTVNKLVLSKPGVLGPNIKPHPEGAKCSTQESASVGKAPEASAPPMANCGISWYYLPGGVKHAALTDYTIADAVRAVAGIGENSGLDTRPIVDATGISGKFDLTVEYRFANDSLLIDPDADDGGALTLIGALKRQLGLKVETGDGPIRMVTIDHISEPTPD